MRPVIYNIAICIAEIFFLLAIICVIGIGFVSYAQPSIPKGEIDIEVVFIAEPGMFPWSWQGGKVNAKARSLKVSEIERSKKIIDKALQKYPVGLIESNLEKVYILDTLEFCGISASGTISARRIYLVNKGTEQGYTDNRIEQVFHAELSSILLRNYRDKFNEKSWQAINGIDFCYAKSGKEAIRRNKASLRISESCLRDGFLNEYAKSTLENDFNQFAKYLFCRSQELWVIADQYDKIRGKVELIISFYHTLDSSFTKERFESFIQ